LDSIVWLTARVQAETQGRATPEERFEHYVALLTEVVGHADRAEPLRAYTTGLMLPGERKSVEPMAARVDPRNVRKKHQSMHHFAADAPWDDGAMLAAARAYALPFMLDQGPVRAWIVDDTGIPKKGRHSVGVARQYCGQLGKTDNCQVAVSLSLANECASLPVAYRLYLPEEWADDRARCKKASVPEGVGFQPKPQIALDQIRGAVEAGVPPGVVLADAGYGTGADFRDELTRLKLEYAVGVLSTTRVWAEGEGPLPPKGWRGRGRPPTRLRRDGAHHPVTVKDLAVAHKGRFRRVTWREGTKGKLSGRFLALRVRSAHRDYTLGEMRDQEWLLVEWPENEPEPTKYFLSTLPKATSVKRLVETVKIRWRIEHDYEELKQELGLTHYEGRGWRGFHHHATLTIAAYAFLVAERGRFSPSGDGGGAPRLKAARVPRGLRPRGSPAPARTARADLDRDDAPPADGGAGAGACPMPVLPAAGGQPRAKTKESAVKYEGTWHITEMEAWDDPYLHMEGQAYIRIRRDGGGQFQFGLVSGEIDGEVVQTADGDRFEFTWDGNDECDPASGSGWLEMEGKNKLEGAIKIHHGDSSTLAAERATRSKARK
jgi:SRSO17 transposase